MKVSRLATVSPVRYALAFALCASLVMAVLLAVVYWWMSATLARHLDESLEAQLQVLRASYAQGGASPVIGLVRQHGQNYPGSPLHFAVQDGDGRTLAGDLPPVDVGPGWHDVTLEDPEGTGPAHAHELRGRGEWLGEDLFVLVTTETRDLQATRTLIVRSFVIALLATVVLALGGGLAIGHVLLRRVEAVDRTARRIMDGDLSQRIPVIGPSDELAGLAEVINAMLARIEELMANLHHVSSAIAHDLRTPLGHLRQRLETARARPRGAADYEAAIDAAIADTDAVLETFEAMLRIADIEAGARRERFEPVDLSEVAADVSDAFAAVVEDRGGRLRAVVDGPLPTMGDRALLTQMLANLVENAIRHTPAGSTVSVLARRAAREHHLIVEDTGQGIPADQRDAVFRPFYRLDQSRTTPGSGLGLGLVAAVVKLHGGRIRLEDAAPGLRVTVALDATNA